MRVLLLPLLAVSVQASTFYVTVAGLGGEPEFEQRFHGWAAELAKVLKSAPDAKSEILEGAQATKANLRSALERIGREAKAQDALVVMLIGHGTFDGAEYKFNLPGPDLTGIELAAMLDRVPARQAVINMTSASGGAIAALHKENRVIVSATKAGSERNATVFARYWTEALRDGAADTDKNETVSALEAFRYAEAKTAQFYDTQKRLATEHPVLEDTGRGEGVKSPSPENGYGLVAATFPVLRLGSNAAAAATPQQKALLAKKQGLEEQIDRLKYQKAAMALEEYRKQLGALVLELAKVQAELEK